MKTDRTMTRSLLRVLLVTGVVLLIPLVANQFTDGEGWSLFDFALVGGLIMGAALAYELAIRWSGTTRSAILVAGVAAVGGAAAILGEADDAPGLILIGFGLFVTAVVMGVRTMRGSGGTGSGAGAAGGHAGSTGAG